LPGPLSLFSVRGADVGRTLRIFSGNLLNGRAEMGPLLEQVEELRVDVLALQEVRPHSADAMADTLSEMNLRPLYESS
jgi:endonuclease/exonuclease/phosphatase family metal-dependent hydrolase